MHEIGKGYYANGFEIKPTAIIISKCGHTKPMALKSKREFKITKLIAKCCI
jgi:hypothetical protein